MPKIEIYTTRTCGYCRRAKALLASKGLTYEEHDATSSTVLREEAYRRSGRMTVPQIFIDGVSVGGSDELAALDRAGELDRLLNPT